MACGRCGADDLVEEPGLEGLVCGQCGLVAREADRIVSEPLFAASGRLEGQRLRGDDELDPATRRERGAHSRLEEAAQRVAGALGIEDLVPEAMRLHRWARQRGMVPARRHADMVSALLYLVCRRERTQHLLVDFAEVVGGNPFYLGSVYGRLVRTLQLGGSVPAVDPVLLLPRLAARLALDDDPQGARVEALALRITTRMKRDWMSIGRAPNGLCAGALYMACQMLNVKRTLAQVTSAARVCARTVRDRTNEFMNSRAAQLSMQEFERLDLVEEELPPAFLGSVVAPPSDMDRAADDLIRQMEVDFRQAEEMQAQKVEGQDGQGDMDQLGKYEGDSQAKADSESVSDLDDEEARKYLRSKAQVEFRQTMWEEMFADHVRDQAERREKRKEAMVRREQARAEKELAGDDANVNVATPRSKRQRRQAKMDLFEDAVNADAGHNDSAAQDGAAEKPPVKKKSKSLLAVQEAARRKSSKINLALLSDIF